MSVYSSRDAAVCSAFAIPTTDKVATLQNLSQTLPDGRLTTQWQVLKGEGNGEQYQSFGNFT